MYVKSGSLQRIVGFWARVFPKDGSSAAPQACRQRDLFRLQAWGEGRFRAWRVRGRSAAAGALPFQLLTLCHGRGMHAVLAQLE